MKSLTVRREPTESPPKAKHVRKEKPTESLKLKNPKAV